MKILKFDKETGRFWNWAAKHSSPAQRSYTICMSFDEPGRQVRLVAQPCCHTKLQNVVRKRTLQVSYWSPRLPRSHRMSPCRRTFR
jgi:hypothetical protein